MPQLCRRTTNVLSVGLVPILGVLCVSITQATTREYFVAVLMMLQANSGVLLLCWFGFLVVYLVFLGRVKFTENQSVKITNLFDGSMGLLLVLSVLHVGGFVYATLVRIVENVK